MTKTELQRYWLDAALNGTLVIPKHDPTGLAVSWPSYRTVLTPKLADNLDGLIASGQFQAFAYENVQFPTTPHYIEVIPTDPQYSVTSSGVPTMALTPDYPKDRLIFYSGQLQGWHCCGEDAARIQVRVANGTLIYRGPVT